MTPAAQAVLDAVREDRLTPEIQRAYRAECAAAKEESMGETKVEEAARGAAVSAAARERTMTRTIKIYGASDDLIEVEEIGGDHIGSDEAGGPGYVELSTGAVFRVWYDEGGCWRVMPEVQAENTRTVSHTTPREESDDYTEILVVSGPIDWIDFWQAWPPSEREVRERLADQIDLLSGDALRAAYMAARGYRGAAVSDDEPTIETPSEAEARDG